MSYWRAELFCHPATADSRPLVASSACLLGEPVRYDGTDKHATEIGKGAFIGSDTMLVAPVKVGDGATTGAGSTITQDVPSGALAVERSRQRNIEGWAERRDQRLAKRDAKEND